MDAPEGAPGDEADWEVARLGFLTDASQDPAAPTMLARLFAEIAASLFAPGDLDAVLQRIASTAVALVPGCDHASISVAVGDGFVTPVATDELAVRVDDLQYAANEGPCLDAITGPPVYVEDLWADERWPALTTAEPVEVCTVASFGLRPDDATATTPSASLNLYGRDRNAITEGARELGMLLAAHSALALAVADERARASELQESLQSALLSRDVIGQAKGILMERQRLTGEQAFEVLRRSSQLLNVKLRDLAQQLTETGELPLPPDAD